MRTRITVTLNQNLVEEIDVTRGDIPRSRFIERLLTGEWEKRKEKEEVRGYV